MKPVDILLKKKWKPIVSREGSPPLDWLYDIQEIVHNRQAIGYEIDITGNVFFDHLSLYSEELVKQTHDFFEKKFAEDKSFFLRLAETIEEKCNEMIQKSLEVDVTDINGFKELLKISGLNKIYWIVVVEFPDWLKKKAKVDSEKPLKQNFITKYNIDLVNVLNKIRGNKVFVEESIEEMKKHIEASAELKQLFDEFIEKYFWIGVFHFTGKEMDLGQLLKEIKELLALDKKETVQEPVEETELNKDTKLLRYYIFLRTHMAECQMVNTAMLKRLCPLVSKKFNVPEEVLQYLTADELRSLIEGKLEVDAGRILGRKKGYLLIRTDEHNVKLVDGKEFIELKKEIESKGGLRFVGAPERKETEVVKGAVANKGIVQGPVKIILNQSDFFKVEKGDIIVAPSTTPNFVIIMAKAAAFVTDEGGIGSHAAIVSREMNKPCIVGTHNATKVLKDGDLVEVDAVKGIVRKLE